MQAAQVSGWILDEACEEDLEELMTWFPDAATVDTWSGPEFRYPFTSETFFEDCRFDSVTSYALRNEEGLPAAFGQSYERHGRGHLARLVVNPAIRRQGAGRRLVSEIIDTLDRQGEYDEYSLFVYRHNTPAYRCYLSLGFVVQEYPADAAMADKCYFLTKKKNRRKR